MKYFIGIVPPEEVYQKLLDIQTQHGDNRLEPHITLRPPVVPSPEQGWLQVVEQQAAAAKPFEVLLPGTGTFGKRVMFVRVESAGLLKLHAELIPALKDFEPVTAKKESIDDFHPHLTLGRAWCGFTADDFESMKKMAEGYLLENDVRFVVSALRIYYKPDPQGRYQTYKDVPLAGDLIV